MANITQREINGLYELTDKARKDLQGNPYWNDDIAPTPISSRTWKTRDVTSLWVTICICIPAFTMAAGLVALGLSPWLAVLNVTLGNLLVLIPIQLNSAAGTKYGIPFPLFCRMSFGVRGAHIPSLARAVAATGWNGVQCWIGAAAIVAMVSVFAPSFGEMANARIIGFIFFVILSMWVTAYGERGIKKLQFLAAPVLSILTVGVFAWATVMATNNGYSVGDILQASNDYVRLAAGGGLVLVFLGGLTANIGFWGTLAINIPDFSRYASSQRAQFRGQLFGMPFPMFACAFIGAYMGQATALVFGEAFFDPTRILEHLYHPVLILIVAAAVAFATLTTNIMANIVAPANSFSNLAPRKISFKVGVIITGVLAFALQPWALLARPDNLFFNFIGVYGGIIAPLAAIFIADYFIIKEKKLDIKSLFLADKGRYWYSGGFNMNAIIAWACGFILPTIGRILALPPTPWQTNTFFIRITANAYIFGFAVAFIVYVAIMKRDGKSTLSDEDLKDITENA